MAHLDEKRWAEVIAHEDTQLGPPASEEAIKAFESTYGLTLPVSYRKFLMRANGGIVGSVQLFGVGRLDYLDLDQNISEMRPCIEETAPGPVLPFSSSWGGDYFCYDLTKPETDGEYPVLCWNHEYSEEPADRPLLWTEFAANFAEFVRIVITGP